MDELEMELDFEGEFITQTFDFKKVFEEHDKRGYIALSLLSSSSVEVSVFQTVNEQKLVSQFRIYCGGDNHEHTVYIDSKMIGGIDGTVPVSVRTIDDRCVWFIPVEFSSLRGDVTIYVKGIVLSVAGISADFVLEAPDKNVYPASINVPVTPDDNGMILIVKDGEWSKDFPTVEKGEAENSIQQFGSGAKAISPDSVAFIQGIAGCKGYRYKAISKGNLTIYLTTEDITYVSKTNPQEILTYEQMLRKDVLQREGYEANILFSESAFDPSQENALLEDIELQYNVGDTITFKARSIDFDRIGTITEIYKNRIRFSDNFQFGTKLADNLVKDIILQTDVLPDRYGFMVAEKPLAGPIDLCKNAVAIGSNAIAAAKYGIGFGANVIVSGDGGVVFGVDSEAGYQSTAFGELVKAMDRNMGFGYNVANYAIQSVAAGASLVNESTALYAANFGYQNRAKHRAVFMAGEALGSSKADHQIILGKYPNTYEDMLLVLGDGSPGYLHNAFVVWNDGRATVSAWPINENDVVNLSYLTYKFNTLPIRAAGDYAISMLEATAQGRSSVALITGRTNGVYSGAIGFNAKASSSYAISIGALSEALHTASMVLAYGGRTGAAKQLVLGQYNAVLNDENAILLVGNGRQDNIRSNALVVWKDGHVECGKSTASTDTDKTLVTLDYVKRLEARIAQLESR